MTTTGRRPIQIVEIDLPICTRTYGTFPCTAALGTTGDHKCFNTWATCQASAAYSGSTITLRFARNQSGLPRGVTIFPALSSVSTNPASVNLSGIDPSRSALGKRASVTVTLQDFTYHDTLTDPYRAERVSGAAQADGIGYDPGSRGTFLAKMHARWPYYLGRNLRVLEGYEGEALSAMRTRNYVVTGWKGPDAAGVVTITAKDILDLADKDKARAPVESRGKLQAAITATSTSFTVEPASVGDEYDTAGILTIGREVMRFTRSGDVFTITERGAYGTTSATHAAKDVVQQGLEYVDQGADAIISDLLTTFAGIPSGYMDTAQWATEIGTWLGGMTFSAVITKPEGVATLIGELSQHGFMIWWDEVAQKIKVRANRPLNIGETYVSVSDAANIIEGSVSVEDAEDERASRILFWHGVIDPTDTVTDGKNFRSLYVATALEYETEATYNESRVKEIFSRWFGTGGDDANAAVVADRLISRYRLMPVNAKFRIDAKDRGVVGLADLIEAETRQITDATGAVTPTLLQVQSVEETDPGHAVEIVAQSFRIDGRFGFIMPDGSPDYTSATADEIATGCFILDESVSSTFPDNTRPYVMY